MLVPVQIGRLQLTTALWEPLPTDPPANASYETVTSPVHSGRYAAAFTVALLLP